MGNLVLPEVAKSVTRRPLDSLPRTRSKSIPTARLPPWCRARSCIMSESCRPSSTMGSAPGLKRARRNTPGLRTLAVMLLGCSHLLGSVAAGQTTLSPPSARSDESRGSAPVRPVWKPYRPSSPDEAVISGSGNNPVQLAQFEDAACQEPRTTIPCEIVPDDAESCDP